MGVAGIVAQMNKHIDGCAIAIDGSVFEHYPGYKFYMEQALVELLGHNKTKLVLTKDGSGNGAAITAAVL
jgi:hexokinase